MIDEDGAWLWERQCSNIIFVINHCIPSSFSYRTIQSHIIYNYIHIKNECVNDALRSVKFALVNGF